MEPSPAKLTGVIAKSLTFIWINLNWVVDLDGDMRNTCATIHLSPAPLGQTPQGRLDISVRNSTARCVGW